MKKIVFLALLVNVLNSEAQTFTHNSNELGGQFENAQFFNIFGCAGENKSPQLFWENPPKETQSFAVTIFDEDGLRLKNRKIKFAKYCKSSVGWVLLKSKYNRKSFFDNLCKKISI